MREDDDCALTQIQLERLVVRKVQVAQEAAGWTDRESVVLKRKINDEIHEPEASHVDKIVN